MSSSANDVESTTAARGSPLSAITHKWKVILPVVLLLGAIAAVAVCAAVVVTTTGSSKKDETKLENARSLDNSNTNDMDSDEVSFLPS